MKLPDEPPAQDQAMTDPVTSRMEWACEIARQAGRLTLEYFQRPDLAVESKQDRSPVTAADRGAEQLLRERIEQRFPDDAIVGEEFPEKQGTSPFRWIVDPIDGTKSFIRGVPLYGTLIGIERDESSVAGVIHIPGLDETLWAASGGGAWHQRGGQPARRSSVSSRPALGEGLFVTSQVDSFAATGRRAAFDRLEAAARITRTWGDCYGYLLVATGRAEVMVDPVMSVWDAAAVLPILEEAGGTFTDWQGVRTVRGGEGIGCNGRVLDEVLALVR